MLAATNDRSVKDFRRFLDLPFYFEAPCQRGYLAGALAQARDRAQRKIPLVFGRAKSPWAAVVAPRLEQLLKQAGEIEALHVVADAFEAFQSVLYERVYRGSLLPIYRGGNFSLERRMREFLSLSPAQADAQLPTGPGAAPGAAAPDVALMRADLRDQFAHRLRMFKAECEAQLAGVVEPPLAQNTTATAVAQIEQCDIERMRKRLWARARPEIEALEHEIARARERAEERRRRRQAQRSAIAAEIAEKEKELAGIEATAVEKFTELHLMLVIAQRHLAAEKAVLARLRGGTEEEPEIIPQALADGGSISDVTDDFYEQWALLAFSS
jgi:hypothetical protein